MCSWKSSELPKPTKDCERVKNDLDEWGYGLLEDALTNPLLSNVKKNVCSIKQLQKKSLVLHLRMVDQNKIGESLGINKEI